MLRTPRTTKTIRTVTDPYPRVINAFHKFQTALVKARVGGFRLFSISASRSETRVLRFSRVHCVHGRLHPAEIPSSWPSFSEAIRAHRSRVFEMSMYEETVSKKFGRFLQTDGISGCVSYDKKMPPPARNAIG